MAMGKRATERQQELFIAQDRLPKSVGHVFYVRLNELLAEADFDQWVETLCEPYYANGEGRPSIPPGVYFRMLLVGYFEGIGSQRGIAWRCSDSLSLRAFLGVSLTEKAPDHSSLSIIRNRLPLSVHEQVFLQVLAIAQDKKLLKGKTVAVDSTTLEANAAMKSIVRRDTNEDWNEYLTRLMQEEGLVAAGEQPNAEELRRFDKSRENKSVSNREWESPNDPDSRITRMKDGTTHLAYKAEHVIDLDSGVLMAAEIYHATEADTATLEGSVVQAQMNQEAAGSPEEIKDVVADKGYHAAETLTSIAEQSTIRTYIPEPRRKRKSKGKRKPPAQRSALHRNRRRTRGSRGRKLQRLRSERVERSFAHVCETGGARRTWLTGIENVQKRYLISAAAHNLGCLMRALFKMGTPRGLQQFREDLERLLSSLDLAWIATWRAFSAFLRSTHATRWKNDHRASCAASAA